MNWGAIAPVLALVLALAAGCTALEPTATPTPASSGVPSPTPTQPVPAPTPQLPSATPTPSDRPGTLPAWLDALIFKLSNEPVSDPPAAIFQYEYKGRTVYYLPPRCCDIFSDLYDAGGALLGHPDGGITGQGDGRVPDFFQERKDERTVWKDERMRNPNLTLAEAPIQSVDIVTPGSFPPQYRALVVSGLPNSCVTFAGYRLDRRDATIQVELLNWVPVNQRLVCAQVYQTTETSIPLGSDFVAGKTYTVMVNGFEATLVAR